MEKPIIRLCYRHFKGKFYYILGFAIEEESKEEVVIYSSLDTGEVYTRKVDTFFDRHPSLNVPRFELAIPK